MSELALSGRVGPADRSGAAVLRLPFEVPAGTTRIDVAYRHDEGHILDLGLADVHLGPFPSQTGFRGWSGGARKHAFVATDDATPGYIAGPILEGTWHVLLGLARVDAPCEYRVDITFSDTVRATLPPFDPNRHTLAGPGWYAGDLQSHTHHSDARGSLEDLAIAAAKRGLDYVAVTDHNTVSHHRGIAVRAPNRPLLIPGEEVTTYRGHANVWGAEGWIDFRAYDDGSIAQVAREAHAHGGLFAVNHPKVQPGCIGCDWEYNVPIHADAFEAWQGPWPRRNWESLARYDALLAEGRRLSLVGGSDRHQSPPPERDPAVLRVGSPTTWIYAESLSVKGLLDGLRRGRVCVSEAPDGPRLDVTSTDVAMGGELSGPGSCRVKAETHGASGDRLRWLGPTGVVRTVEIEGDAFEDAWTVPEPFRFLRAEIVARDAEHRYEAWSELLSEAAVAGMNVDAAQSDLVEARAHPWVRSLSNPLYHQHQTNESRGAS